MRSLFLPVGLMALLMAAGCNSDRPESDADVSETIAPDQTAAPAGTGADASTETDTGDDAPGGLVMPENGPPIESSAPPVEDPAPAVEDQGSAAGTAADASASASAEPPREPLVVGSKAPPLDIEHWVQQGPGDPVSQFEQGKVYVVEFWATWCGPCISSMPHLAEIQQQYADQGVRIVSVSNEPLATVESFLERPAPSEEEPERTFRQLTSVYSLTTDPDESVYEDYMRAANQNGIPTAFIVGKSGHVEWIGHPMNMDEPLSGVVNGSWDREAYAEQYLAEQRVEETVQRAFSLARQGDTAGALDALDAALQETDQPSVQRELNQYKLQLLVAMGNRQEEANQLGAELLEQAKGDNNAINSVTWLIYQASNQGGVSEELIGDAIQAAEVALKDMEADERAYLLDTLAHLHEAAGNLDAAIAAQQEAVDVAESRFRERLKQYLEELKQAKTAEQDAAAEGSADAQQPQVGEQPEGGEPPADGDGQSE